MDYRKTPTESDLLEMIRWGGFQFPPLVIKIEDSKLSRSTPSGIQPLDAILIACWGDREFRFGAEVKSLSTPKIISDAIREIKEVAKWFGVLPLVIVPYLNPNRLAELEAQGVSGIDLCGNGVVVVPGELLIYRTGKPNRFRQVGMIKNVYRGASSIVARLFLLVPELNSVQEALAAIHDRGGEVTLGTVSKVCSSLDDDLIIERKRGQSRKSSRQLRLLQPETLLEKLVENYEPPEATVAFTGKWRPPIEEMEDRLRTWEERGKGRVVRTGESSVNAYAVMAREPVESFYCTDLRGLLEELQPDVLETGRFPNVQFVETRDEAVYFDRGERFVASPIQVYLELAKGEKRQQETALQVRRSILAPLGRLGLSPRED